MHFLEDRPQAPYVVTSVTLKMNISLYLDLQRVYRRGLWPFFLLVKERGHKPKKSFFTLNQWNQCITRWRSSAGLISTTSWAGHPILPDRKWREVQENPIWPHTGELTLSRQMRTWVKNINMSSTMPCKFSWFFTGSDSSFRISPGRGCADIF